MRNPSHFRSQFAGYRGRVKPFPIVPRRTVQTVYAGFRKGIELRRSVPAAFECLFGLCKIVVELLKWFDRSLQCPVQGSEPDLTVLDVVGF